MRQKCFSTSNKAERKKTCISNSHVPKWVIFRPQRKRKKNSLKLALFVQIENSWWGIPLWMQDPGHCTDCSKWFVMIFWVFFPKMLFEISHHTSGITLLGIPKERGRISLCSVISIPSPASASESAYLHPLYWVFVVVFKLKRINFTDSNPPGYI